MFPKKPTQKQVIGRIGEDCACQYLKNKGYKITDRNYLRKWGEIDIVAKNNKKLHFIEVKSVSRDLSDAKIPKIDQKVSYETKKFANDSYRPEDNMHPWKLQRLGRVIQSYLLDKDISDDIDWQFDVATVYIDMEKRISRVFLMENVVL